MVQMAHRDLEDQREPVQLHQSIVTQSQKIHRAPSCMQRKADTNLKREENQQQDVKVRPVVRVVPANDLGELVERGP
mgnify:FL=1